MGLVAAIVGLALLVLIHEAGHFFAARAVGMTPRKFYLGFGPPHRQEACAASVEYGIGALPLGGYVKIPGMNRPSPGDLAATLQPAVVAEHQDELSRLDDALRRDDEEGARAILEELRPALGKFALRAGARVVARTRTRTGARRPGGGSSRSAPGPAVNLVFALVLFTALFLVATTRDTNDIGRVARRAHRRRRRASRRATASSRSRGARSSRRTSPPAIRATDGRPFTFVVLRNGRRVSIGPLRAALNDGAYRIGIAIEERTGPGESLPAAIKDSRRADVGRSTASTVGGLGHLARGQDTNQVSSSVGIVRMSAQAWRRGCATSCSCSG